MHSNPLPRLLRLALLASVAGLALLTSSASARGLGGTISYASFRSRALAGTLHYSVYLPPGYARSGKRYPVVYYLHGLPATDTTYRDLASIASAVEASGHPAIVIGVQGARSGDTDPEWLNWGSGRNWETATAKELVAVVDARYRTIASRAGRVLVGVSAGGYGATLIALHNPRVFAVVESWSGYFHATTPSGLAPISLGSTDADDWADAHKLIARAKKFFSAAPGQTYFAFYVGSDDARFKAENLRYSAELKAAGIKQAVFRLYNGGHGWSLWSEHATNWIARALAVARPAS